MKALIEQSDFSFQNYSKRHQGFLAYDRIHDLSPEKKEVLIATAKLYLKIINTYFINNRKLIPPTELKHFRNEVNTTRVNCRTWTLKVLSKINMYSFKSP